MRPCLECATPIEGEDNLCPLCREEVDHIFKPTKGKMITLLFVTLFRILIIILFNPLTLLGSSLFGVYYFFGLKPLIITLVLLWGNWSLTYFYIQSLKK